MARHTVLNIIQLPEKIKRLDMTNKIHRYGLRVWARACGIHPDTAMKIYKAATTTKQPYIVRPFVLEKLSKYFNCPIPEIMKILNLIPNIRPGSAIKHYYKNARLNSITIRMKNGITRKHMAKIVGVHNLTIFRFEMGLDIDGGSKLSKSLQDRLVEAYKALSNITSDLLKTASEWLEMAYHKIHTTEPRQQCIKEHLVEFRRTVWQY